MVSGLNRWFGLVGRGMWRPYVAVLLLFASVGSAQDLQITYLQLLDSENGYAIPEESVFYPGEVIHFRANVIGFGRYQEEDADDPHVKLSWRLRFTSPSGKAFATAEGGEIDTFLAPQDDKWSPILRANPRVPFHGESGKYKIFVEVTDHIADRKVATEIEVLVEGKDVEVGERLAIRNFAFTFGKGGDKIEAPRYRPGETVFASFYITGFVLGDDNKFAVESGLELLNAAGEQVYEFNRERETGNPFYPRRWLPGDFEFELDRTIPVGTYSVRIWIADELGDQRFETKQKFVVQ